MGQFATDRELADAIQRGNESAANEFCTLFARWIRGLLLNKDLVSRQESEDVVQEILICALSAIRKGNFSGRNLKPWLYTISVRRAADYRRHRGDRLEIFEETARVAESPNLRAQSASLLVSQLFRDMPQRYVTIFRKQALEGFTIEEIAKQVRKSPGRVGVLLAEAKRWAHQYLNK